jgi:ribosomal protein S18 acetylase RimI-like enzyme
LFFVRSAAAADMPAVSELLRETWHATYDALYGVERVSQITDEWHSVEALMSRLSRPGSEFIVADDGERIGGMCFAALSGKTVVVLHQLYVRPHLQRRGIGRDLFAEMETCFDGARTMRLEVEERNGAALAFYRRHGFEECGRSEDCGQAGFKIPSLVMEKSLIA